MTYLMKFVSKRRKNKTVFWWGLSLLVLLACSEERTDVESILFIGHGYQWTDAGNRIDYRLERLDFADFTQIWLGGDICAKASHDRATLVYFDLSAKTTHWALGNHDLPPNGGAFNPEQFTNRPSFYLQHDDSLGVLVLNTNLFVWPNSKPDSSFQEQMARQSYLVESIDQMDLPIAHLVVLHHHCVMTNAMSGNTLRLDTIFNDYKPMFKVNMESDSATFERHLWPHFQSLQTSGVQVVFVGGDLAMQAKSFAFQTGEGIWFLGAGINNSVPDWHRPEYLRCFDPDQVLEFTYDKRTQDLSWTFRALNEIAGTQGPIRDE